MTDAYPDFRGDYIACPSGLVLPEAHARARYAPKEPACIDLFCGGGGMSLGLTKAGWRVLAALDNDPAASITYMVNLCRIGEFQIHFVEKADEQRLDAWIEKDYGRKRKGGLKRCYTAGSGWISRQPRSVTSTQHFIFGDIRKVSGADLLAIVGLERGEVDCVAASPPCQGFSHANPKRKPDDPRNGLVWEWLRIVMEIFPKTIVMENVPGILSMTTPEGVPVVDQIARVLEDGGFGTADAFRRTLQERAGAVGVMRNGAAAKAAKGRRPKMDAGHALTLAAGKVAVIFPTARLNAARWLRDTPLRRIRLMTPRPSMPPGHVIAAGRKPGGGRQDFCWLVFERDYVGLPQLDWLCRDEGWRDADA